MLLATSVLMLSFGGLVFLLSSSVYLFAMAYPVLALLIRSRRVEDGKGALMCSDGVVRGYDEAIAFEERLFSGEPPEASWGNATTRMR